jgi:hypothetical protein
VATVLSRSIQPPSAESVRHLYPQGNKAQKLTPHKGTTKL